METKPYDLQSPEQIAKDYGGNKQKIAEAMQMGILDPTAGTLAGMFIDRMRSAAQQEAAPQQTVAQQVFAPPAPPQPPMGAPPAPPAGLGATPQAAAMPPMGPPPEMGAPPPQAMPAPQGEMPMMAEGGMVPPYASGGLTDLPVPDGMFDEPNNGGYAGGGIVAFAAGARVDEDEDGDGNPDTYFGYNYKDPSANAAMRDKIFGAPETKYAKEFEADLLKRRSPEGMGKLSKAATNMAMIEAGIAMANSPGSILQSATKGIGAALPGFKEAAKERRAEEREIQRGLIDLEQGRNTAAAQKASQLLEMQRTGIQGREGQIGREFQTKQQQAQFTQQSRESALDRAAQIAIAGMRGRGGDGSGSGSGGEGKPKYSQAQAEKGYKNASARMTASFKEGEALAAKGDMAGARKYFADYAAARRSANEFALAADLPEYTTLPTTKSKGIQAYTNYVLKHGQPGSTPVKANTARARTAPVSTAGFEYLGTTGK